MSNPYIQFELDAAKKAPILASALGIQLREAMGGLALMWLHVYGAEKGDTVTGFFLRSFFGAAPDLVGEALVELGFAEQIDATTWRVRGAGRYTRLSDVRREAGRKGAAKTNGQRSEQPAIAAANGRQNAESVGKRSANERQAEAAPEASQASAQAEQAFGKGDFAAANARQTVGKNDEEAVLPRQKAALDPRSEIRDLNSEIQPTLSGVSELPPRARAYEPPASTPRPPPAPPPPKLVLESLARWQAAYGRMVPMGMIHDDSVLTVAADFTPEDFAAGVKLHCDETDRGLWTHAPLKYLRKRCEWARRDRENPKPGTGWARPDPKARRGVDRYGRPRALTIAESDEIENERRAAAGEPLLPPRPTEVIELFGAEAEEYAL